MSQPSAPSKFAQAVDIAAGMAYILVVAGTIYLLFPGLRQAARTFAQHTLFNYRYGLFLAQRSPVAGWVNDAIRGRVIDGDGLKAKD